VLAPASGPAGCRPALGAAPGGAGAHPLLENGGRQLVPPAAVQGLGLACGQPCPTLPRRDRRGPACTGPHVAARMVAARKLQESTHPNHLLHA